MPPNGPLLRSNSIADMENGDLHRPTHRENGHSRMPSLSELQSLGVNPQRKGVPKRDPNATEMVGQLVRSLGGDGAINSVLVANNGLAAVKFMRSIRSWATQTFGSARAIALVAMATPEDIRINAEHVTEADQFVEVPGGTNNNNYANVKLIVAVAQRAGVDAVWPGWGHASENPELPSALAEKGIRFLGPPAAAMAALGDKIGSTILAQAAGVPTLPWSGSGVAVAFGECNGVIPQDVYDKACMFSLEEAIESCHRIGYPVMLKASWGGGGKGIRKVHSDDEVRAVFKQIQGEVPGSPIFAMKLAPASRHLEVQLIADAHGNVCSLFTRDCSVQRRHQKIVEEGPALAASQELLRDMERCARALARSVRYVGAATVEYLYCLEEQRYYFLELNPRLQVEHPVTEGITGVNIPSTQLLVGMGVPLTRIPAIRATYNLDPKGTEPFDLEALPQRQPDCHVVAVRITSENAGDGFKPTAGRIDNLVFKPTPEVWGYFSVRSGGGIHEFSDSQFGHLFAKGETRDSAIRAMVVALRDVQVRGEIHTIIDYAADMLQSGDFTNNNIHTGWLDARIAANVKAERPPWHLCVIGGAVVRAYEAIAGKAAEYLGFLSKGQLPPPDVSLINFTDDLVIEGVKYRVKVLRRGPTTFNVAVNKSNVDVVARKLGDGGYLLQVDGESHVIHTEENALGTRLVMDTLTCLIAKETDPSRLIAASPGKLTRHLVSSGQHVTAGMAYAEVEVMKMMMPLVSPAAGVLAFAVPEGSVLNSGDLIARLELNDPAAVTRAVNFTGALPELGPPQVYSDRVDHRFTQACHAARMIMAGYTHPIDDILDELVGCLDHPALPLLQWSEEFSFVESRLPAKLAKQLEAVVHAHEAELNADFDRVAPAEFPGRVLLQLLDEELLAAPEAERVLLQTTLEPLMRVAKAHSRGAEEYARSVVQGLLEEFLSVEEQFQQTNSLLTEQEIIDTLRKAYAKNHQAVLDLVVSHQGLVPKEELVKNILSTFVLPAPVPYRSLLRRFAALSNKNCAEVALRAQQLLEVSLLADMRAVVARALSGLDMFADDGSSHNLSPNAAAAATAALTSPFGPFSPTASAAANMPSSRGAAHVVPRKATMLEGVFTGLNSFLAGDGRTGSMLEGRSMSPMRRDSTGMCSPHVEHKIETLVAAPAAVEDALASLIVDHHDKVLQSRALVTYVKRVYHPFLLREPLLQVGGSSLMAAWIFDDPSRSNTSAATHLAGAFLVLPRLDALAAGLDAVGRLVSNLGVEAVGGMLHIAVCGATADALALPERAQRLLTTNALLEADASVSSVDSMAAPEPGRSLGTLGPMQVTQFVAAAVADAADTLRALGLGCVSVLVPGASTMPLRNGFVWDGAASRFRHDPYLRQVEAPVARLLELGKLAGQQVTYSPSRNRQWHMYSASERKDTRSPVLRRMYMRGLIRQLGHPALLAATYSGSSAAIATAAVNELEEALINCLEELTRPDHSTGNGRSADWVHIYHSVLPLLPLHQPKEEPRVAAALRTACAALVAKHNSAFRAANVAVWEMRFRVPDASGAWRVVVSCPTGHEAGEEHVEVYREALTEPSSTDASTGACMAYALPPSEAQALPGQGAALHGRPLLAPYPPLASLQMRRLAARRHNTTYCYDFPTVFENALRDTWAARAAAGEPNAVPPSGRLVEAQELVLSPGCDANFRSASLSLDRVERGFGLNDVGMVAWAMTLKTPECPQGRQVIAVANDITFQSGAFGPKEDALFRAAGELALEERLPLVYLAANSGARVGLAGEVRDALRVQWVSEDDPTKGFQYLYLDDADYVRLAGSAKAELLVLPSGERRWVLKDVIGAEDGLGVENLSGSGAIASLYCRAFREGFTITLVSGRTVGIGAYLARLGRRCVQRSDQPIILTGYAALNKLLGRQVYTSHMQLGGPRVMGVNGVSHHVVDDDLEGVKTILRWLSYTPAQLGTEPPLLPSADPVERPVGYAPSGHEKLEPRAAIAGREAAGGSVSGSSEGYESGLFDRGSWSEAQAGWARTVVTGRARLGGIPVGVVAVETQMQIRHLPADPGMLDSSEQDIPQAGQVWFPDSADKTAQAIEEFDREGLPLFILANWRGFSGGQRDLFDGVLQAGSLIVEQLRSYKQPVFVYIPCGAELRGGAWVVVDSQINPTHIEMYADPRARGGVLEPEGLVEIKYRTPDLIKTMHRLDPVILKLIADGSAMAQAAIKVREKLLLPVYQQVARQFADMHDTPSRMFAKGVLSGVVPWREARAFFAARLKRRLTEEALVRHVASTDMAVKRSEALSLVQGWHALWGEPASPGLAGLGALGAAGHGFSSRPQQHQAAASGRTVAAAPANASADAEAAYAAQLEADRAFLAWADSASGRAQVAMELRALRSSAASRLVREMLATGEGKEGLLKGLQSVLATDSALETQLRLLLAQHQQLKQGQPLQQ